MNFESLRTVVLQANLSLPRHGLALFTWGNASGIDRERGLVVIKPSGVEYAALTEADLSVVDLDGRQVGGGLKPSSDLATHLALFRAFPELGGVVHTHSAHATAWAQAGLDLPAEGTTHADHFYGDVPCTRALTPEEIAGAYELETGRVIAETFRTRGLDPAAMPAVLVRSHGPFTWGEGPMEAVENAVVLEEVARIALLSRVAGTPERMSGQLLDKHFLRKHGKHAYYGQPR